MKTVIVDEIHAIADDKRGAHLALSLERLDVLTGRLGQSRIGLSATQKPIEIDRAVSGRKRRNRARNRAYSEPAKTGSWRWKFPRASWGRWLPTRCGTRFTSESPSWWQQHRSTLIFVNTRRLAERVAHNLAGLLGEEAVASHHGSLSRQRRLAVESKLKAGELRALVATASLELGIDIGTVDLVCQIGSPRSIAVALQRVGRAGHWRGAIPKGRIFATTRDELLECAALVRAIRAANLDRIIIPECAAGYSGAADCGGLRGGGLAAKTIYSRWCAAHIPTAISRARNSTSDLDMLSERNRRAARPLRRVSASRSGERPPARAARQPPGRDHQRRRDSR